MIARLLVYLRARLRRRKAAPVTRDGWDALVNYRRPPTSAPRWINATPTTLFRELTAAERDEDPRPPAPRRPRWLDRPGA
ncbi:MAG: hypothetical protein Q7W02_00105 [Candidatus Rokubacteria bacterium]|nr:hypothetical protein [Candidatus Rokubacteria bacterium]